MAGEGTPLVLRRWPLALALSPAAPGRGDTNARARASHWILWGVKPFGALGDLLVGVGFHKVEGGTTIGDLGQNASKESELDASSCCDGAFPMLE